MPRISVGKINPRKISPNIHSTFPRHFPPPDIQLRNSPSPPCEKLTPGKTHPSEKNYPEIPPPLQKHPSPNFLPDISRERFTPLGQFPRFQLSVTAHGLLVLSSMIVHWLLLAHLGDTVVLTMKHTEHRSYEVLIGDQVTLRPCYDRLDNQLLEILCKQITTVSSVYLTAIQTLFLISVV